MNGYILYNNGSIKYSKSIQSKKIKNNKAVAILTECWHPIFGIFYVAQNPKTFKQTMQYATKSVVSYRFLDGVLIEDDDDYLFVKNKYWYNNSSDLFAKIFEIMVNEYIFNDSFWVYDSFFQYIYDDLKIKLKGKKRKKRELSGREFYSKFIGKPVLKKEILQIENNKWSTCNIKKSEGECLFQIYHNIFIKVDSELFKLGKSKIYSDIYLVRDDFILNQREVHGNMNDLDYLRTVFEVYVSKYVIRKLEAYEDDDTYLVKTRVKFKNKKLNKKKYKFGKFIRKYFIDMNKTI